MPAIKTITITEENEVESFAESLDKMHEVGGEQWILFTTPKGVESFFSLLAVIKRDIRQLYSMGIKFGVVGNATRIELRLHGIEADYMPEVYCGEELAIGLLKRFGQNPYVTLYRAKDATKDIVEVLADNQIAYQDVAVYHTVSLANEDLLTRIGTGVENQTIDYVMFTSASCVKAFTACLTMDYTKIKAVCIGEQTAATASKYGMQVRVSKMATIDSMIDALIVTPKR